jgi:glycerophosphoryl diester phosphodiesterase
VADKIQIIAHRGASGLAPENTIAAFNLAVEMGCPMIELDVQMTRDQKLVVIHDSTVNRTTNGRGAVSGFRLEELRRLDAGSWFGVQFRGERIPTLPEVIQKVGDRCRLNIEVKKDTVHGRRPVEEVLIEILAGTPARNSSLISSFDYDWLTSVHQWEPRLKLAYLFAYLPWNLRKRMASGILAAIHPHHLVASRRLIQSAHDCGLQVNVWTVDKPGQMLNLACLGVDGMITNNPEVALSFLTRK